MTNLQHELSVEQQRDIKGIAEMHAKDFETVVSYAETRPDVDVAAICDHYVTTLVNVMMPRSVAVKLAELYVAREDHEAHLRSEEVARIDDEIATLREQGYDLVAARLDAIEQLRGVITPAHLPIFNRELGLPVESPEPAQPKNITAVTKRWIGVSALRSAAALRAMFATQS